MYSVEKSRAMREVAKKSLAGGVASSFRLTEGPLFIERADGSRFFDVDGNEYIDYRMGAGPLILGHCPKPVLDAVKAQLEIGILYDNDCSLGIEVSQRLVELIPCADLVRFTNSGSEADHVAIRLARAYTGREKIIRFEGHYHGWFDNIYNVITPSLETIGPREARPATPGSAGQGRALEDVLVLPWNDLAIVARTVAEHRGEIAGVIMVPIMFGPGAGAFPREGYLEGMRDICTKNGIVLIFDEIITGFRVAQGGAQELFGVLPDLAVYAKAIAAGFPMGLISGRKEIMSMISRGEVMHAGTYNGNPVCLAAAKAALRELTKNGGQFYSYCDDLRQQLTDGIYKCSATYGIPVHISGAGAVMQVWFTSNPCFYDYRSSRVGNNAAHQSAFVRGLHERGVHAGGIMFITSAHTQEDIEITLRAVDEVMGHLQAQGHDNE